MFSKTTDGAKEIAKLLTIVETAKRNNLNVEQYLVYLAYNINKDNMDDFLPWNKKIIEMFKMR